MEHFHQGYMGLGLLGLILLSAFFSATEIGMMSLNRYRLKHLAKQKHKDALRVKHLLDNPERLLGVILIGNTFANILAAALANILAVRLLGDVGVLVATVALTLVIFMFAEIAPKTVAAIFPEKIAFGVALPITLLEIAFRPIVWVANRISHGFLRLLGIKIGKRESDQLNQDELRTVVREAGSLIPKAHQDMLVSLIDLEKVIVEDIMVPKNQILGIDLNEPLQDILEQLELSQHTRLPIFKESINHIVGMIHLREVLHAALEGKLTKEKIIEMAEPIYFVPENTSLYKTLFNLQNAKTRSGLVVDEFGDIIGLITLEDILEEVVGEFTTDMAQTNKDIQVEKDGSVLVDGRASIRDINRTMKWQLPLDGPKTISGLIIEKLEFIPQSGTSILINDHPVEVLLVTRNLIKTARINPTILTLANQSECGLQ